MRWVCVTIFIIFHHHLLWAISMIKNFILWNSWKRLWKIPKLWKAFMQLFTLIHELKPFDVSKRQRWNASLIAVLPALMFFILHVDENLLFMFNHTKDFPHNFSRSWKLCFSQTKWSLRNWHCVGSVNVDGFNLRSSTRNVFVTL